MPCPVRRPTFTAVLRDYPPHLKALLRADCVRDDELTASLWSNYFASRSTADETALINFYMPAVAKWVQATVNNRPNGFPDPLEDYISDGMLGLIRFIRRNTFFTPGQTYYHVRREISKAVWDQTRQRSWAGKYRTVKHRTLELIRASLISELGTLPTREQVMDRLRVKVTNPNYYFSSIDEKLIYANPRSQLDSDQNEEFLDQVDHNVDDPSKKVFSDEVADLCLKGLKGIDRKIFKMLLKGKSFKEICDKHGLLKSTFMRRLNGVLWEAKARADLAKYIGADPAPPPKRSDGHYPEFNLTPKLAKAG